VTRRAGRRKLPVLAWTAAGAFLVATYAAFLAKGNVTISRGPIFMLMRSLPTLLAGWGAIGLAMALLSARRRVVRRSEEVA
jgi:hypothetical protein